MRLKITFGIAILIVGLSCGVGKESSTSEMAPRSAPVQVGEMAPEFTLEDQNRQKVTLSSARGSAPVVLIFYRGHW